MRASRFVSAAAFSLLVGALALVAPPASADGEVTVVWPEITAFNPDTTEYIVNVSYESGPRVFLVVFDEERNQEGVMESEGPGPHTIPFSLLTRDGTRFVEVVVCDPTCVTVSTSPDLIIRRVLPLSTNGGGGGYFGPDKPVSYTVGGGAQSVDLDWELREGPEVIASGDVDDASTSGSLPPFDYGLVEDTEYTFRIVARADVAPFGPLSGARTFSFEWDRVNESRVIVAETMRDYVPIGEIYPVADGFVDQAIIRVEGSGPYGGAGVGFVDIEIRDSGGEVVFADDSQGMQNRIWAWNGHDAGGQLLPEGTYSLRVTAKDSAWNVMTFHRALSISHDQVVRQVWRRSFLPGDVVVEETSGTCGWLKRPARVDWLGSLGFYTRNRCDDSQQLRAGTRNRVVVPESVTSDYGMSRVTVVGGKAQAERKSRLKMVYLYKTSYGEFNSTLDHHYEFAGNVGRHPGGWGGPGYVADESGEQALYWDVSAQSGDRYDVRRYIVEVEYDVLQAGASS